MLPPTPVQKNEASWHNAYQDWCLVPPKANVCQCVMMNLLLPSLTAVPRTHSTRKAPGCVTLPMPASSHGCLWWTTRKKTGPSVAPFCLLSWKFPAGSTPWPVTARGRSPCCRCPEVPGVTLVPEVIPGSILEVNLILEVTPIPEVILVPWGDPRPNP